MKPSTQVSVEVGLTGGHVMVNVPYSTYEEIKKKIKQSSKDWLSVNLENGAEFELNISAVQYLRMRPQGVRALSSKGGLTLKEIADILGASGGDKRGQKRRCNGPIGTTKRRVFLSILFEKLDFQRSRFA